MTKHDNRRFRGLCLILIAGYVALLLIVNLVIGRQQEQALRERSADYALLRQNKTFNSQRWLKQNKLAVYSLTPQSKSSSAQRFVSDLAERQRNQTSFFARQKVAGHSLLFYIQQTKSRRFALATPQQHFWQTWPQIAWLVTVGYVVIGLGLLGLFARQRRLFYRHLKILVANIHSIRHAQALEPIIFQKDASLYILAQEVNKLTQDVQKMRQRIAIQQGSFDRLIDHLPVGVMVINEARQVVLHNEAMANLLETTIVDYKHPYIDDVKTYSLTRMIEHTFRHRKSHHQEIKLIQNEEHMVDANVLQLNTVKSKYQVLVILYDLTDIRRVEQMQLDFVGNVSHELKTPVTAISGFAETLLAGAQEDPAARQQFLQIIFDESTRLTALIQDILALSHLDQKNGHRFSKVGIQQIVQQNLQILQQAIQKKHLQVDVTIAKELMIKTDATKLNQILKNLIANGVTYNKFGGTLQISATKAGGLLTIRVSDTGVGIPSDLQERIFERFYRVDRSRAKEGTGLGLAIAREITESLGGHLNVTSQLGVGSTFKLILDVD